MEGVIRLIFDWFHILVEFGEQLVYYMSSSIYDLVHDAFGSSAIGDFAESVLDFLNIGNTSLFEWIFVGGLALIIVASIFSFFSRFV